MSVLTPIKPILRPVKKTLLEAYDWWAHKLTGFDKKERASDVIIIGYPKTGTTWLVTLLTQLFMRHFKVHNDSIRSIFSVTEAVAGIPTIVATHDDMPNWKPIEQFETSKYRYRNKKVLFLVRDPRDVLISYYFWYTLRNVKAVANDDDFDGTLSEFIDHRIGGVDTVIAFYNIWAENRHVPKDFLMMRYEELHEDPHKHLMRALRFLGINGIPDSLIDEVIDFCQFANMRKLEKKGVSGLRLPASVDPQNNEVYKTRKGKVGGFTEYLSDEEIAYIDAKIQSKLSDYYSCYKYRTTAKSTRPAHPIHYKQSA
jgi:sulfotransferase family protein